MLGYTVHVSSVYTPLRTLPFAAIIMAATLPAATPAALKPSRATMIGAATTATVPPNAAPAMTNLRVLKDSRVITRDVTLLECVSSRVTVQLLCAVRHRHKAEYVNIWMLYS